MFRSILRLGVLLGVLLGAVACGGQAAPQVATPTAAALDPTAGTRFVLDSSASEARFTLGELLRGNPTTVVGVNNQVSAELRFDPADLSNAALGPVTIDAAGFVTDSDLRNRAIQSRILLAGRYPTITFVPTALNGLPAAVSPGETVAFTIVGDLSLLSITLPVTFDATVTYVGPQRIEGSAVAVVRYADFDVRVPSVPAVAGVDEEVELALTFVAVPAE